MNSEAFQWPVSESCTRIRRVQVQEVSMSKLRKSINFTQMCLNEQSDIPLVLVRCRRHLTGEGLAHARDHLQLILEMFSFLQT